MARSLASIDFRGIIADFQNLNPRDVGAWPVAPRATVLVVLCLLILLAGWWFYWDDQLVSLREKQEAELRLRDEYVRKKAQAVNLDLYVQRLSDIDLAFGALLKQLPNKAEVESLAGRDQPGGYGPGPAVRVCSSRVPEIRSGTSMPSCRFPFETDRGRTTTSVRLPATSVKSVAHRDPEQHLDHHQSAVQRMAV
jgi:hypothetical protein